MKKYIPYIIPAAAFIIGVVVGYLVWKCPPPQSLSIENELERLKNDSTVLADRNQQLYFELKRYRTIDSVIKTNEKDISNKIKDLHDRGYLGPVNDSLLQRILAGGRYKRNK